MSILRISKDGVVLQEIEIQAEQITIGREPENDVRLGDLTVSRRHGQLKRHADGRYFIEDLNSRNGIRLNGHKIIEPVALTDGDQLKVGAYQIAFLDSAEVSQLRQTHLNTTTGKSLPASSAEAGWGVMPHRHGSRPEPDRDRDASSNLHVAAKPTQPLAQAEAGEQSDQPLEIGILVNEANNAIFAIERDQVVLGSDDDVDIRVPGPPRTRAIIARRGGYFYICSETPAPCVSVNGRPVMNSQLVYNDRIEIGGRRFIFREI